MRAFRLCLILLLAAPFLMGAAPRSSKLSPHLRFLDRVLTRAESAKPGAPATIPGLFQGAVSNAPRPGVPRSPGEETMLHLIVVHNGSVDGLRDAGFSVATVTRRTAVISVPHSRLHELERSPEVFRADPVLPLQPYLDLSLPEVNAHDAHGAEAPPYPEGGSTGEGVVVGIVDTGVDATHQDFRDAEGNTRISYIWDQNDNLNSPGPPPGYPCSGGRSYCGNEWTTAQINSGASRQRDEVGHGTHVLGCAASDGSATGNMQPAFRYIGVAPEAEIIAVNTAFLTNALIEGVAYIFGRAGSKPCVVNLSLGSQFGPHDGTSTLDLALSDLTGPGRIIVAAAGNEGDVDVHAELNVSPGNPRTFDLQVPPYNGFSGENALVWCDGWYASGARLSVTVVSPNGIEVGPVAYGGVLEVDTTDGTVVIDNSLSNSVSGDREVCVILYDADPAERPQPGIWSVEMAATTPVSTEVDIWMAFSSLFQGSFPVSVEWLGDAVDAGEVVSSPASADNVIGVGAYTTRTAWISLSGSPVSYTSGNIQINKLAPFSSTGPRRDGVLKPEITAPGIGVGSTSASNITGFDPLTILEDGVHRIDQGTSQATPHVSGTVALILQNNPNYDCYAVMEVLKNTARADAFTGNLPNATWGYGKLDAGAAAGYPVPVRLLSLTVELENGLPAVRWSLAENEPGSHFQIERGPASDGPFRAVSEVLTGEGPFVFVDPDPVSGERWYRVRHTLRTGVTGHFGPVRLDSVDGGRVRLLQNVPNPFAAGTVLTFELDDAAPVRLEVLDVRGRRVRTLRAETFDAGRHDVAWDGLRWDGRRVAAGVYFYRLTTPRAVEVRRLVVSP